MCGIVGVIGKNNTTEVLIQGLEKLEYRGYDSAGIFVQNQSETHLVKSKGKIDNLKEKLSPEVQGNIGIGHTRWATHGQPTENNAHPHVSEDGRFVLVHNGVIENYDYLKMTYLKDINFKSDTDTEVIVQLIAKLAKEERVTAKEALISALSLVQGSYALGLIEITNPDKLYVAKNKSPLLIGLGDSFNVICSDALAMIQETNEFVEISDGEIVTITSDEIIIENPQGEVLDRHPFLAKIDLQDIEKGQYDFYMMKEIDEQPIVIRRIIQRYTNDKNELTIDNDIIQGISNADRIYIIGCGTSWHAGWVGKQIIEKCTSIPVEVHLSSEFAYNMPILSKKPFFIFLSQSGETADSRQVLVNISRLGYPSLTITNSQGSTLSRESNYTLLLHAGPEIAVASTKAYTAQIAIMALLAKSVGTFLHNQLAVSFDLERELSIVATGMETMIDEKEKIEQLSFDVLQFTKNTFYIGRSLDYYVSMEAALKLKEISYIQAEGFAAGELKHGTIALIEDGTPVFGIITEEVTGSHTRGNLKEVESRGANVVTIVMEGLETEEDNIILPKVHALLTPLLSVVPTQLIAYYASVQRGYDVDKPRNLAKSVTVE